MSVPWINDEPTAWNTVAFDGDKLPGLAKVAVNLDEEIDVKKPKGKNGASSTRQGVNLAKVTIHLRMWTPAHFAEFQRILKKIRPNPRKGIGSALKITHPKTAMWDIPAIDIQSINDKENEEKDTIYDVVFSCLEHLPTQKKDGLVPKTETRLEPRSQVFGADLPNVQPKPSDDNVFAE